MTAMSQATPARFWDKIARSYAAKPVANPDNYRDTLRRTRTYLSHTDHVLEVGCGTASTAILLARDVAHISASDISTEMVEIGKEKVWSEGLKNVRCVQGVLGDTALGDGPYDAVLAFNLMHLVPDPEADARHAYDLLKPGGYFISKSGAIADGAWFLWPVIKLMQLFGKAPYVGFYRRRDFQNHVTAAGFEIVETHDYPGTPVTQFLVAQKPVS